MCLIGPTTTNECGGCCARDGHRPTLGVSAEVGLIDVVVRGRSVSTSPRTRFRASVGNILDRAFRPRARRWLRSAR